MPKNNENAADRTFLAPRFSRYTETLGARLWRDFGRVLAVSAGLSLAFAAGGCSTSYQLGSVFGKDEAKPEALVSPAPATRMSAKRTAEMPRDADLALAKAAAAEVLARGSKDASVPWENPRTGARGTVTPIASAYTHDGNLCHDFLASYVRGDQESWYQGDACRSGSKWVVRDIRPLQRT